MLRCAVSTQENRLLYANTMVGLRKDIGKVEPEVHEEGVHCLGIPCSYRDYKCLTAGTEPKVNIESKSGSQLVKAVPDLLV